ncbi:MAG TPA: FkbM family methyltransferase [Beijerinckiaceae bacterium]|nr:FkbM family methyltransferase [Beijerinckiaceae bacterium]HVB88788.1 FkbM family methyltransferase [Beijerinckiaceae bacterium]
MRHILIDIGGHLGQTVEVALDGSWRFDHVYTFEPHPDCAVEIRHRFSDAIAAGRLTVHQAAVGARTEEITLLGDNSGGGATIVPGMLVDESRRVTAPCIDVNAFIETSAGLGDRLYIKLNCEGGEVAIVERLCDLRDKGVLHSIMADFDIVKSRGGFYVKRETIRRASSARLPLVLSENVMVGKSHAARTANWFAHFPELAVGPPPRPTRQPLRRKFRYLVRDLRSAVGGHGKQYQ